jgi:hypothetical protein
MPIRGGGVHTIALGCGFNRSLRYSIDEHSQITILEDGFLMAL